MDGRIYFGAVVQVVNVPHRYYTDVLVFFWGGVYVSHWVFRIFSLVELCV